MKTLPLVTVGADRMTVDVITRNSGYRQSDGLVSVSANGGAADSYEFAILPLKQASGQNALPTSYTIGEFLALAEELKTANEVLYADPSSSIWGTACVTLATVDSDRAPVAPSSISNTGPREDGTAVVTLKKPGATLTSSDIDALRRYNETRPVIVTDGKLSVCIPAGALSDDFDPNRLLADTSEAETGMVVEFTPMDGGEPYYLPWAVVDAQSVKLILPGEGDVRLVSVDMPFQDVVGRWSEDAIAFTTARGLFRGVAEDLFAPALTMSRSMFVTVLWRLEGAPESIGASRFIDLDADWYLDAVAWAEYNGIIDGRSDELFAPNDPVSRQEMCVLLCRYLEGKGYTLPATQEAIDFIDQDLISDWVAEPVRLCTEVGLINGIDENIFAPLRGASREEVSTILQRFIVSLVNVLLG